jgi:calcineurin-like phosphoesterase family protein
LKLYKEDWIEIQLPLFSYKNTWITHCPIHPQEIRGRQGVIHGHLHGDVVKETIWDEINCKNIYLEDKRYFNVNLDNNDFKFVSHDKIMNYFKTL